jgi:hypothetical protein
MVVVLMNIQIFDNSKYTTAKGWNIVKTLISGAN